MEGARVRERPQHRGTCRSAFTVTKKTLNGIKEPQDIGASAEDMVSGIVTVRDGIAGRAVKFLNRIS